MTFSKLYISVIYKFLRQLYAVLLLKKTVEQEGKFQVQEQETLPDGTVRIKVGRWV